ncbi:MAG: aminopeptidase P family protein, partial [Lachnospiraceae bacterium]|nr:aminopeptidase P family protein [Lachnospiraceae bacterium]
FIRDNISEGAALGFDGRVVSAGEGKKLEDMLSEKNVSLVYGRDLSETIRDDRPRFPCGRVYVLPGSVSGRSVCDKLTDVRNRLKAEGADSLLLTKLDDIMWLFNIRGCDVECNPVAMSYAYVDMDRAVIFIQGDAIDGTGAEPGADGMKIKPDYDCRSHFKKNNIEVMEYDSIAEFAGQLRCRRVLVDVRYCSYMLYKTLLKTDTVTVIEKRNPTELLKAVKNAVELDNMRKIFLKDSVALTKFIFWLKANVGRMEITEVSAADRLEEFRREIPEFIGLSFPTISGYRSNAAMMHYEARREDCKVLKPEGMLLVDSGGQYMGGTTDVTRTIVLGPITEEEKLHYTLTAVGMLKLTAARWLYGCSGRNLDILAREPLWNINVDYKCGTGHGVGYIMNVHEAPQSMRWRFTEGMEEPPLEAGMVITNEPGVYIEGSHGIRIENVMVAENDIKNEYGQFMHFDTLTWVPIDMGAIDRKYMSEESYILLMSYQKKVYEKISPYLNEEEREWLRNETQADTVIMPGNEEKNC